MRDGVGRSRWERATRLPLLLLAFVYLAGWTVLAVEPTSAAASAVALGVMVLIWLGFIVDFLVRLALAERRGSFVVANLADLVAVLLPALRPGRCVTSARSPCSPRAPAARSGCASG